MATEKNITIISGDTKNIWVNIYEDDSENALLDLNGSEIEFIIKPSKVSTREVIKKAVGSGVTHEGLGRIKIVLTANDTKDLSLGNYYYHIKVIDQLINESTVTYGVFSLT